MNEEIIFKSNKVKRIEFVKKSIWKSEYVKAKNNCSFSKKYKNLEKLQCSKDLSYNYDIYFP